MKTNSIKFGASVVVSGQKSAVVNAKPELIALTTKGGFMITSPVSKRLGIAPGENIMFVNTIASVEQAIATNHPDVVAYAQENGIDMESYEGHKQLVSDLATWYIAKAYAKKDKNGEPLSAVVRVSSKEKAAYLAEHIDEFVAENREELIAAHKLDATASDEDIKKVVTVDDVASPTTVAYEGAKTAASSSATGVGLKLTFSDSSTWDTLKDGIDEDSRLKVKRVFKVCLDDAEVIEVPNGNSTEKVTIYPIEFVSDEEISSKTKDTDVEATSTED